VFVAALAQLHNGKVYPVVVSAEPTVVAAVRRAFMDALLPLDDEVWGNTWREEEEEDEEDGG
jgi:hypothetical protein